MSDNSNNKTLIVDDHLEGLFDPVRALVYIFDAKKYNEAAAKLLQGAYVHFGNRFGLDFISDEARQRARDNTPPEEYAFGVYPILPNPKPEPHFSIDEPRPEKKKGHSPSI